MDKGAWLVCCSPWGLRESDTTERLKNNTLAPSPLPPSLGKELGDM